MTKKGLTKVSVMVISSYWKVDLSPEPGHWLSTVTIGLVGTIGHVIMVFDTGLLIPEVTLYYNRLG